MTKTITVKWLEKMQFVGTDSGKHSVVMSTQDEANGTGMVPSDLLLVSLGGCTSFDVANILQKKRQPLAGLEVTVTGESDTEFPRPFRAIHVHYRFRGTGLSEKAVRDAIELSEKKYCMVAATVQGIANLTYDYEIVDGA